MSIFNFRRLNNGPDKQKQAVSVSDSHGLAELLALSDAINGTNVTPDSALRLPVFLACVQVISQSLAMLPINIFERSETDGLTSRKSLKDHDLYKVLSLKPNDFQSPFEFKLQMTFNAAHMGNAYAHITRLGNRIIQLVPLKPGAVTVKQRSDYSLEYTVSHVDGVTGLPNKTIYEGSDIFHLRGLLNRNGYEAESPVKIGRNSIAASTVMEDFARKYFNGNARARGAFRTPGETTLGDEAFERLKGELSAAADSDTLMLLENGLEYIKLDYSARESQFNDTRKDQRIEVCRLFRIPPHMVHILDNATFSNIEHQSRDFVDYTLMPWLQSWEGAIRTQLLDPLEESIYPKISAQAFLRGDNQTRSAFYQSAVQGPWMTANEARNLEDMDEIEGGNDLLQPLNMAPAGDDPDENAEPNPDNDAGDGIDPPVIDDE